MPYFLVFLDRILKSHHLISPHIIRTPIMTSPWINSLSPNNKSIFFKCENMQKTGSIKARGAANAVLLLLQQAQQANPALLKGVATHSSGNHGLALAWAASELAGNNNKIPCSVVVPKTCPDVKKNAILSYGANLILCEEETLKESCEKVARETGYAIVSSCDDYDVISGQATMALEMHQQVPEGLDAILVPTSGGGILAGIALATKAVNPGCKIIAVTPEGKELGECLKAKQRLWKDPPVSLLTKAKSLRNQQLGFLTFPIACELVEEEVLVVSDDEMLMGVNLMNERFGLEVEMASGAAVAAALTGRLDKAFPGVKKVGVILSG